MVIYEMVTNKVPFKGLSTVQVAHNVASLLERPEIPLEIPPSAIVKLMTSCWSEEPKQRPTFTKVLHTLKEIENELKANPGTPRVPAPNTPANPAKQAEEQKRIEMQRKRDEEARYEAEQAEARQRAEERTQLEARQAEERRRELEAQEQRELLQQQQQQQREAQERQRQQRQEQQQVPRPLPPSRPVQSVVEHGSDGPPAYGFDSEAPPPVYMSVDPAQVRLAAAPRDQFASELEALGIEDHDRGSHQAEAPSAPPPSNSIEARGFVAAAAAGAASTYQHCWACDDIIPSQSQVTQRPSQSYFVCRCCGTFNIRGPTGQEELQDGTQLLQLVSIR